MWMTQICTIIKKSNDANKVCDSNSESFEHTVGDLQDVTCSKGFDLCIIETSQRMFRSTRIILRFRKKVVCFNET